MKKKSNGASAASDDLDIPATPAGFFKKGVMGKYYGEYARRHGRKVTHPVVLEEDVALVFQDSASVNRVLRAIINNVPQLQVRKRKKTA